MVQKNTVPKKVKDISPCRAIIKKYRWNKERFEKLAVKLGVSEIRIRYRLTPVQFYVIKNMLKAVYPCQRNSRISKEYLKEQELKAKTKALLPSTPEEYHKFYYENVSKSEQRRRRKGYEGFFKYYGK
jgi:hypothetical protein